MGILAGEHQRYHRCAPFYKRQPSRSATVGGRAETAACTRWALPMFGLAASPGGNHDELGAAFWYGLDDRALSREQIAVACRAGEPW